MLPHYPYTFLTRLSSGEVPVLVYHFRSTKTKRWYIVRVEQYPHDFYGIKFYLKSDGRSPRKYNRLTGLNEPRPIIYTCIAILMELAERYPNSSFGFIGANLIGESENETKRFRVYRRILTTYFSEEHYLHYQIKEKSAYALVRKTTLENNPNLIKEISTYFSDNYTDFD
jgi:hypothetical protein